MGYPWNDIDPAKVDRRINIHYLRQYLDYCFSGYPDDLTPTEPPPRGLAAVPLTIHLLGRYLDQPSPEKWERALNYLWSVRDKAHDVDWALQQGATVAEALDREDESGLPSLQELQGDLQAIHQALEQVTPILGKLLNDSNPAVREMAAWTLGVLKTSGSVRLLTDRAEIEITASVLYALLAMIEELQGHPSQEALERALGSSDPLVRALARLLLMQAGSEPATSAEWLAFAQELMSGDNNLVRGVRDPVFWWLENHRRAWKRTLAESWMAHVNTMEAREAHRWATRLALHELLCRQRVHESNRAEPLLASPETRFILRLVVNCDAIWTVSPLDSKPPGKHTVKDSTYDSTTYFEGIMASFELPTTYAAIIEMLDRFDQQNAFNPE